MTVARKPAMKPTRILMKNLLMMYSYRGNSSCQLGRGCVFRSDPATDSGPVAKRVFAAGYLQGRSFAETH
jgi:hypothetical protein